MFIFVGLTLREGRKIPSLQNIETHFWTYLILMFLKLQIRLSPSYFLWCPRRNTLFEFEFDCFTLEFHLLYPMHYRFVEGKVIVDVFHSWSMHHRLPSPRLQPYQLQLKRSSETVLLQHQCLGSNRDWMELLSSILLAVVSQPSIGLRR